MRRYTVQALAALAGVTPRTLRFYDRIGLLSPVERTKNGERRYGEAELLRLQHILFYRELEFPLSEIKRLLTHPSFDARASLVSQAELIRQKQARLRRLQQTIQRTIHAMDTHEPLDDKTLYAGLTDEQISSYKNEAKERWGHTDAYKQSQARVAAFTKRDWEQMQAETTANLHALVALQKEGVEATSPRAQQEIAKHFQGICRFYDCTPEIYHGLADMYLADDRFRAHYTQVDEALPEYLANGMHAYANTLGRTR